MMVELKFYSLIAVTAGFGSMVGALNMQGVLFDPDTTFFSATIVTGLFVAAIGATWKVTRFIDGVLLRLDRLEKKIDERTD
jgi:hypothetical protein